MPDAPPHELTAGAALTIRTLGEPALFSGSAGEPLLTVGKPLALLIYLACTPGRSARREHLQDLLWADLSPDAGDHALRQTLWYIRKKVPHPIITARAGTISLSPSVATDRDALLLAAEARNARGVVEEFGGDFVPNFAAPGGGEFERWADVERGRLRSIFTRSADALVRQWLSEGRFRDAQNLAERLRQLNRDNEGAWRLLLECRLAAGDTLSALAEADALEHFLAQEEQEPEPATAVLLRLARSGTREHEASDAPQPVVLPLVGRQREFSTILDAWQRCRDGRSSHVHVIAPAGLGKTRLLHDIRMRLRTLRARVILARASIGQRDIPYALISDVAAAAAALPGARGISPGSAATLVAMNPTLSSHFAVTPDTSTGAEALRRRTIAMCELLDATSQEHPIAVLVDDLHWSDDASLAVFRGILEALSRVRILLLTSSRPMAQGQLAIESTAELHLPALSVEQVAELLAAVASFPATAWARQLPSRLDDATDGSPLLLVELLRLLRDEGVLDATDGEWRCDSPDRLAELIQGGSALRHRVRQLQPIEFRALSLITTAGAALPAQWLARALQQSEEELAPTLTALEQKGLTSRNGKDWLVSHDEIAAAVQDATSGELRSDLQRRLGRVLLDHAQGDASLLRRAARLLADAGDGPGLHAVFHRFARIARRHGDRRPNPVIAEDLLGTAANGQRVRQLVRSLPVPSRLGLYSRRRVVSAIALAVVAPVAALTAWRLLGDRVRPPDAELAVFVADAESGLIGFRTEVREAAWRADEPLGVERRRPHWRLPWRNGGKIPAFHPNSRSWFDVRSFADSGGIDIVAFDEAGVERRVTHAPGDEGQVSFSPDGRFFTNATARWDSLDHLDVAVTDATTGVARALTRTDAGEVNPRWSPDGTRIAFTRMQWTDGRWFTCTIHVDGAAELCAPLSEGIASAEVVGWLRDQSVLLRVVSGESAELIAWHPARGSLRAQAMLTGWMSTVSPDGRWLACQCLSPRYPAGTVLVMPLDRTDAVRPLALPSGRGAPLMVTWLPQRTPRFIDTLRIRTNSAVLQTGVPHQLPVEAADPTGEWIAVTALRWISADTTYAVTDPVTESVIARRAGVVRLIAVAGGWRSDTVTLTAAGGLDSLVLQEPWRTLDESRWLSFGTPRPGVLQSDAVGPALANNGDGKFASGVIGRRGFPSRWGLALEAVVSVQVTMRQWQYLTFGVTSLDPATVSADAARSGAIDWSTHPLDVCHFAFPAREGPFNADSLALFSSQESRLLGVPASLPRGRPFRIRVQVLPDGRCGLVIDGRPVALTATSIASTKYHVQVSGNSHRTAVLVGSLTVRLGVPSDIDWVAFERESVKRPGGRSP